MLALRRCVLGSRRRSRLPANSRRRQPSERLARTPSGDRLARRLAHLNALQGGSMTTQPTTATPLTQRPEWHALQDHYDQLKDTHLRQLFADDPARGERLATEAVGIYLDYSKNRITDETLRLMIALAEAVGL